ncbi:hypothetical protein GTO10_00845, partial [Candidatus Saccharibacteria bacterium]|nr:hypothetical protein [Candidatus Saccharibacteria bacterium]
GEDVWQHAMERVRQSDLLVLYAGVESLGAGQEFAYANNVAQTPTVVVIEWDKSLDPAIEGAATRVIRFRGVQDLEDQLIPTIHELVN